MLTAVEGLWNVYESSAVGEDGSLAQTFDVIKVVALLGTESYVEAVDWRHVGAGGLDVDPAGSIYAGMYESQSDTEKALWAWVPRLEGCDCTRRPEFAPVAPGRYRAALIHHFGCSAAEAAIEAKTQEGGKP